MNSSALILAQFGCGYWGPNLLRNFSALPNCSVKYVVDLSPERRAFIERNFPQTSAIESCDRVLADAKVNAVVIATPAETHFSLAKQVLCAGKHAFVEKPLATKASEVDELSRCAAERNLVVMAGHTFIYNPALRYRCIVEFRTARHQHHPILARRPGADFHFTARHGLYARWHRGRCLP